MAQTRSQDPSPVTWALLLGKWTDFARAALALPKDGQGARWRAAVPDIIALQAITHALAEVDDLRTPGDRAVALDLAEMQIREHASNLHRLWADGPLHDQLAELISDARAAHAGALEAGLEWCVAGDRLLAEHPATLVEALGAAGFAGDLFVPTPGVPLFAGCPAVFLHAPRGELAGPGLIAIVESGLIADGELAPPQRTGGMRQAYRQFDFSKGGPVRDLVIPLRAGLPGGQPLLVCAIEKGRPAPVTLPPRRGPEIGPLPVEFADSYDA